MPARAQAAQETKDWHWQRESRYEPAGEGIGIARALRVEPLSTEDVATAGRLEAVYWVGVLDEDWVELIERDRVGGGQVDGFDREIIEGAVRRGRAKEEEANASRHVGDGRPRETANERINSASFCKGSLLRNEPQPYVPSTVPRSHE